MKERNTVILANPCNFPYGIPNERYQSTSYPNLGLLTLGSSLKKIAESQSLVLEILYYDGSVFGNDMLYEYISLNHPTILALCLSSFTSNFQSCINLARKSKESDPCIVTIVGNDHFSFLYKRIITNHKDRFDYGFCGNDIVEGFSNLIVDLYLNKELELKKYPGLVYKLEGTVYRNRENPDEFLRLPDVDYSLIDSFHRTSHKYIEIQGMENPFVKENGYIGTSVNIARGCWKLAGKRDRLELSPNACEFCSMYAGDQPVISMPAGKAWATIKNAFDQGFNYLFIVADEFPNTFWPLIREMAKKPPEWYRDLTSLQRPGLFIGSRGDSFVGRKKIRLDTLKKKLNVDHIFIGVDGYSTESLIAMNKIKNRHYNGLLDHNIETCQSIADQGIHLTVGAVITHLGITPELMKKNFKQMELFINRFSKSLVQFDFSTLIPIPGSHAFSYLIEPTRAAKKAKELGLRVNMNYLDYTARKYARCDVFNMEELCLDFLKGCCPEINLGIVKEYLERIRELVVQNNLSYTFDMLEEKSF